MSYKEVEGDLIKLALEGNFDAITHGCNCLCTMGAGIAPQMARTFGADKFEMENYSSIEKLGDIDYETIVLGKNARWSLLKADNLEGDPEVTIINSYTQYGFGFNHEGGTARPLDYQALSLCLKKINHIFKGKRIGLPKIGCGLAGGDWEIVQRLIKKYLVDCDVTVVIYKK